MISKFLAYLELNWAGLVLVQMLMIFVSAMYGFWSQGLHKGVWDLMALWAGTSAIATAAIGLYGKFYVQSKYNQGVRR